jgi:hypothetical protein
MKSVKKFKTGRSIAKPVENYRQQIPFIDESLSYDWHLSDATILRSSGAANRGNRISPSDDYI